MRQILIALLIAATLPACATGASSGKAEAAEPTSVHGDVICSWDAYGGIGYDDSDVVFGSTHWTVYAGDGRTIYVAPTACWVEVD